MNTSAKVSIILCVYNGEAFLRAAIDSIILQTYKNIELIIIDDGSTDSTSAIIESYKAQDYDGIELIYVKQTNLGLTASLNKAIGYSTGKYIARHDADDISHPERVSLCVDYLEDNYDKVDLILTRFEIFDENKTHGIYPKFYHVKKRISFNDLKYGNLFCHGTFFAKNEIYNTYNYDLEFLKSQDYEFLLRLVKNDKKIVILPEVTYKLRVHSSSISKTSSKDQFDHAKNALLKNYSTEKYLIQGKSIPNKLFLKVARIKNILISNV